MRNVLIVAAALAAFSGSAKAAPRHVWYYVNYGSGACEKSQQTPEETWSILAGPIGRGEGYEVGRISPDDVVKTGNGQIQVTIRATLNGIPNYGELLHVERHV